MQVFTCGFILGFKMFGVSSDPGCSNCTNAQVYFSYCSSGRGAMLIRMVAAGVGSASWSLGFQPSFMSLSTVGFGLVMLYSWLFPFNLCFFSPHSSLKLYAYMSDCVCLHVCLMPVAYKGQKRASDPTRLASQRV